MRRTFKVTLPIDNGKTITAECDRDGDAMAEVVQTMRAALNRLCEARGWTAIWDAFSVETLEERVRA